MLLDELQSIAAPSKRPDDWFALQSTYKPVTGPDFRHPPLSRTWSRPLKGSVHPGKRISWCVRTNYDSSVTKSMNFTSDHPGGRPTTVRRFAAVMSLARVMATANPVHHRVHRSTSSARKRPVRLANFMATAVQGPQART